VTLAQANLQQAAAELRAAEANYKRSRELLAKKYISDAQHEANLARLDKARAALESQKAALASARANRHTVEQTLIRAPFDAIVLTKNADVGDSSPALRAPSAGPRVWLYAHAFDRGQEHRLRPRHGPDWRVPPRRACRPPRDCRCAARLVRNGDKPATAGRFRAP